MRRRCRIVRQQNENQSGNGLNLSRRHDRHWTASCNEVVRDGRLIFAPLLKPLKFPSLTIQFGLIRIDLPLLVCLPLFLSLHLITD